MAYSIAELAKMAGVSPKTLRYYDELGLLPPAYHGSNGYRYYETRQLQLLQQILFFKELGFTLQQIQKVLGKSDFNQLASLHGHKAQIQREVLRLSTLLATLDRTIEHYEGRIGMKDQELFKGLEAKVGSCKDCLQEEGLVLSKILPDAKSKEAQMAKIMVDILKTVSKLQKKGAKPGDEAVQAKIASHYQAGELVMALDAKAYTALATLYVKHPTFRSQLDAIDKELAVFMAEAMQIYASTQAA